MSSEFIIPTQSGIPRLPLFTTATVWLWVSVHHSVSWLFDVLRDAGCDVRMITDFHDIDSDNHSGLLFIETDCDNSIDQEFALLQCARHVVATMPIVMLGNDSDLTTRTAAIQAGAQQYLSRPVSASHVLDVLAQQLQALHNIGHVLILGQSQQSSVCKDILTQTSLCVYYESTLQHALSLLETHPIQVLIIDHTLFDETTQAIKFATALQGDERYSHCCFIFLYDKTTFKEKTCASTYWHRGYCIVEPIEKNQLFNLVYACLRESQRYEQTHIALKLALHENYQQARALNAHAIISITDPHGLIVYVNDQFCTVTGYHRDELLGQKHNIISSGQHDRAFYQTLWNTIRQGRIWRGEICNCTKQGLLFWVLSTIVPFINKHSQPYAYLAMRTDITPIRHHTEQLRWQARALEAVHVGVTIADARQANTPVIYANAAFQTMTGYHLDEVVGQNCDLLLQGEETDKQYLQDIAQAFNSGQSTQVIVKHYHKTGYPFWNRIHFTPVRDEVGQIIHHVAIQEDVTEMVVAQNALRAEYNFIQNALDAIPALFYIINQDYRFIVFNAKLRELSGYTNETIATMSILDFCIPEQRDEANALLTTAFANENPVACELMFRGADKPLLPIAWRIVRQQFDGLTVLIGAGQDMTDYRQVLESLRRSEERLQRSQTFANIGLWDWNIQTNDVYWSEQIPALFGFEPAAQDGFQGLFHAVNPKDRLRLKRRIEQCLQNKSSCDEEFQVSTVQQSRWLQLRSTIIDDNPNESQRMLGVVLDITHLKQAELIQKRARDDVQAIIDSLCALICVVDQHGIVKSVNRSWLHHAQAFISFNQPMQVGINYLAICDQLGAEGRLDMQRLATGIRDVLMTSQRGFETEICNRQDEHESYYLIRITPLQGASGDDPRVVISHQNITENRRIEADLRQAKETAERANQAKSDFLSSMSHELRTPMNAILGFAQLLEQDPVLDQDQRENVHEILQAGEHLLELINDILDLAKIESGKVELTIEPLLLQTIVNECQTLLEPLAAAKNIRLIVHDFKEIGILADRVRIKQVLINLLSNAIKYNTIDGHVEFSYTQNTSKTDWIRITVTDNGPGLAPEQIEHLFEPFTRFVKDDTKIEGTGIGLAVSRRLIEAMGGQIGVSSELGLGCQFWIDLPITRLQTSSHKKHFIADNALITVPDHAHYTILQIDDNAANLKLLERVCAKYDDLHILSAADAVIGLQLAHQHPDLIILDINMPNMNGYAVLETLRANPTTATIPVLALTANATKQDIKRGLQAGFNAYLTKPIDVALLIKTIRELLPTN
jgi:hypothetical protein